MDDPAVYLETLAEPRRSEVARLHELVRENLPGLELEASPTALSYGPFHYRYASGREGDTHTVIVMSRKQAISVYVQCAHDGEPVVPRYADRLPRASLGKSCVRIKRLGDVDLDVLAELLREAA